MADKLDAERRSRLMKQVKGSNTDPELQVRRLLHKLGYRFRVHRRDLPGTPDIVLAGRGAVLFVHGCFWHGHGCRIGQLPKSKLEYWAPKIAANRARDERKQEALLALGWRVGTIWQCGLKDVSGLSAWLNDFLGPPRKGRSTN